MPLIDAGKAVVALAELDRMLRLLGGTEKEVGGKPEASLGREEIAPRSGAMERAATGFQMV